MEALAILLMVLCYGLAIFLWWHQRTPVFLLALFAGHLGALASPLWALLYGVDYRAGMSVLTSLFGQPLLTAVFLASAWFYPLPALLVLFLYQRTWWRASYVVALITYGLMLLYHAVIESQGVRSGVWAYTNAASPPFGLSEALLSVLMGALVSFMFLYIILTLRRSSLPSMLLFVGLAPLVLSVLVQGLLGAPLWISLLLGIPDWATAIGALSTLALLLWGVHIAALGLSRFAGEPA